MLAFPTRSLGLHQHLEGVLNVLKNQLTALSFDGIHHIRDEDTHKHPLTCISSVINNINNLTELQGIDYSQTKHATNKQYDEYHHPALALIMNILTDTACKLSLFRFTSSHLQADIEKFGNDSIRQLIVNSVLANK